MVYVVPVLAAVPSKVMLANAATPSVAVAVFVDNVPDAPFTDVVAVAVTTVASSSTTLPDASRISTTGCTPNSEPPARMSDASVVTTNCVATPGVTEIDWVTGVSATPPTVAEYVMRYVRPATPEMPEPLNAARPSVAVAVLTLFVPPTSVPVATPLTDTVDKVIDTVALSSSTTLSYASTSATVG